MRRVLYLSLLGVLPFILAACGLAILGGGAAAITAMEDRRTTGTIFDDEAIETSLRRAIRERYGTATHVNVTSYNRLVLLTGEVPDERVKGEIEKLALGIGNVRGVTNDLQVSEPSSLMTRANDSLLTSKVKTRLLEAKNVNPIHVKVVTESGVVYLLGVVTEGEANEAVEIARNTGGVRKVVKVFEYCKPMDPICRSSAAAAPSGT